MKQTVRIRLFTAFSLIAAFSYTSAYALQPEFTTAMKHDQSPRLRDIPPGVPPGNARRGPLPIGRLPRTLRASTAAEDTALQAAAPQRSMPAPLLTFAGINNIDGALPPDPNGDVGPSHYVQWVNTSFAIYNKSGVLLYGPAAGNTLWSGFGGPCESTNDGDPIVLYDSLADRWLFSQFAFPNFPSGPYSQCVAVSQTGDPTGAYYRYAFQISATKLNDYPKFGVWPDGYYMSVNQFTNVGTPAETYAGAGAAVFERAKMLNGQAAQKVFFDLASVDPNFGGMLPADLDGATPPPAGTPNYFVEVDDADFLIFPTDSLRIWEFHVDWHTLANSTFGKNGNPNLVLDTAPFTSNLCNFAPCAPQPGTSRRLDTLSDRLMFRLQYRNFGDHHTLVTNHTVNVAPGSGNQAGIRWYELRDTGSGWTIHQQGTYAPDSAHRWMGSAAMDKDGNLAIGFSRSSTVDFPSIYYAGRLASDPLNTLAQGETAIIDGAGSQTHSSGRWGDYTMLAVDPSDDCTFWYTNEYYIAKSPSSWHTRVGSFKFPGCESEQAHDLAITRLIAPARVALGAGDVAARLVKVQIQNQSMHAETITNAALVNLVALQVGPPGSCAAPTLALHAGPPQKSLPFSLKSKQKVNIIFDAAFTDCAGAYTYAASVDHAALAGAEADADSVDDVCPRSVNPPFRPDPNPDGTIKDKGCGKRKPNGTFGDPVVTEVVVR